MPATLKKYKDILCGIGFLIFTIFYLYSAEAIKILGSNPINSRFFPRFLGGVLIILSIFQIADGIKRLKTALFQR